MNAELVAKVLRMADDKKTTTNILNFLKPEYPDLMMAYVRTIVQLHRPNPPKAMLREPEVDKRKREIRKKIKLHQEEIRLKEDMLL